MGVENLANRLMQHLHRRQGAVIASRNLQVYGGCVNFRERIYEGGNARFVRISPWKSIAKSSLKLFSDERHRRRVRWAYIHGSRKICNHCKNDHKSRSHKGLGARCGIKFVIARFIIRESKFSEILAVFCILCLQM